MYWQPRFNRSNPDEQLEEKLLAIREEHPSYGYRRIHAHLRNQGFLINRKKVQRLVQKLGLQVKSFTRKSRKYSSYRGAIGKVAPNLIDRDFIAEYPYQKITTDTTEFKYYKRDKSGRVQIKKLYLDPFMDMYNGEIISYGLGKTPTAKAILGALDEALDVSSSCPVERIFHSDQGWGYQMGAYVKKLKEAKVLQSMSRKGNPMDNSPMENFFGILKQEIYYGNTYQSYDELKTAIDRYIDYYNKNRIKAKLGWLSPVDYRIANLPTA